jgi:5-methylcytosine-specific restriction endonuclease McrA
MADTLVLNLDGAPVSVLPLSTITWQEAIKYMVLDRATVLEWHDDWIIRSERWATRVPAVIMVKEYMKKKVGVRYSKSNVFLRDNWTCQYCGTGVSQNSATLDHVIPVSKGGKSIWENTVCACKDCNDDKGAKMIRPKKLPHKPTYYELAENRKRQTFTLRHPSWSNYL